jgi:predicted  nucleic acid-binding Zn-ribbon protein
MSDQWVTEHRVQFLGSADELLDEARQSAARLENERVQQLLDQAVQQRAAAEAALQAFSEQRHSLLQTIDELQSALAVAGRPLRGEVS